MCVLSHFASAHLLLRSLSSHLISSVLSSSQLKVQRQKTTGAVRFSVSQTEAAEERTKLQANASACASRLNEPAAAVSASFFFWCLCKLALATTHLTSHSVRQLALQLQGRNYNRASFSGFLLQFLSSLLSVCCHPSSGAAGQLLGNRRNAGV